MRPPNRPHRSQQGETRVLVGKTVVVTLTVLVVLVVVPLVILGVWLAGRGAGAGYAAVQERADEIRAEHRPGYIAAPAEAPAPALSNSDERAALQRLRGEIARLQRQNGEEPTGYVQTMKTWDAAKALCKTDAERHRLDLCLDVQSLRREGVAGMGPAGQ